MPPLLADFTHARPCKPFCEKYLTLPRGIHASYPGRHGRMGDKLQKKDGRRKLTILNLFSTFLETECQAKMNPIPDY